MSFRNRQLKAYAASETRFKDSSIMLFKPKMSLYKSWAVSKVTNNIVSMKQAKILPFLTYEMKDGFTGKYKQKTLNRSVKAIKTTSKNTHKKEKHLVSSVEN